MVLSQVEKDSGLGDDPSNLRNKGKEKLLKETGWERVHRMYISSDYGIISPELTCIVRNASATVFIAGLFGALSEMARAREDYFRRNVASTFESQYLAKRKLADTISIAGIKGAVKSGVKYGSFSTLYLMATMTAANYNNKVTVWEHMAAGAIIGGAFRFNYGLKGTAAAGCVGGFLGLLMGGTLTLFMRFTGTTMDDLRFMMHDSYNPSWQMKKK